MSADIREAVTEADISACLALRHSVFVGEQGVPEEAEQDGLDRDARHLIAREAGVVVGTLRMRIVDDAAKLERVCVAPGARGTGLGAALTRHALALAASSTGLTEVRLGAQTQVIGFYERLGFVAHGPVYLDAGLPHRDMRRPL